ncbi:TPA: hypothetical protein RZI73_001621 [Campylobacter coli]|nr:hypothetical protein [Campylobacter coli]HEB7624319.1 hypothetical protein [Campylobacter coli]
MLKNILISLILSFLLIACGGEKNKNSSELIRAQSQGLQKIMKQFLLNLKKLLLILMK